MLIGFLLYFMITLIIGFIAVTQSDSDVAIFENANLLGKSLLLSCCFGLVIVYCIVLAIFFLGNKVSKVWSKFCTK